MYDVLLLTWREIDELLNIDEIIQGVERAFHEKGMKKVQMPPKIYLNFDAYWGDLRTMPAYLETLDIAGVKIVNSHSRNKKIGLPSVMAIIEMIDTQTGRPLAIMDGTKITSFRTGAASAVATKYLARKDSRILGMIGAGTQAYTQAMAISRIMHIEGVRIFDIDTIASNKLATYIIEKGISNQASVMETSKEVVEESDVLVTTTPSRSPIVFIDWLKQGTHINAIGADAPGKRELDLEILKKGKIVVDDLEQTAHSGEINFPISNGMLMMEDVYAELGEIVIGNKKGRENESEITIFDSTGLAILDVMIGHLIYKKALAMNIGTPIKLLNIDKAY
jgi:alanine dehydrogenase